MHESATDSKRLCDDILKTLESENLECTSYPVWGR